MNAAREVLEDELGLSIPICGLAKDDKHKTAQLLIGDPPEPVPLSRKGQEFYLLQRIQDEVHRFAITFHRQTRDKSMAKSILDDIEGIGPKRKQLLLRKFGSIKKMTEATIEELTEVGLPSAVAELIHRTLHEKKES